MRILGQPFKSRLSDLGLFALAAVLASFYFALNGPHGTVHSLKTGLDGRISLQPIFSVPYLLFLPLFWLLGLWALLKDRAFRPFITTVIAVYLISYLIFLLYQTHIDRPTVGRDDIFSDLVRDIYRHDRPYSAFPSLHASQATVFAAYFWLSEQKNWWRWLATLFVVLVVLSTLFVKQHYVVDAISGVLLGAIFSRLIFKFQATKNNDN